MKKTVILLVIGVFLTVSCVEKEQESPVSNVSFTPCVQNKPSQQSMLTSNALSDKKVNVEFTNNGVQITYYDFEVTCDFTTVNVTHTFTNGFLNITQQGSPNEAKCICYTDVSYTINGISQDEVNVIFINGVQVYCYNDNDQPDCSQVLCTTVYMSVSLKLEYPDGQPVLLDSCKVFWVRENRYLENSLWNEARMYGFYSIVDDGMHQELLNKNEVMRFTGYLNDKIVCEREVLVGANCCHVYYLGTEPLNQVINRISNCDKDVIISQTEYENAPNDYLSIIDMKIVNNCLKIKFGASGCSGSSWNAKLIDEGDVLFFRCGDSLSRCNQPPQRTLKFSIYNQEMCAAYFTKEVSFNIEDLQVQGSNSVLLNVSGKSILYEY